MSEELITYQKFNDPALAEQLAEVLEKHGIVYTIEEQSMSFNPTFYADETAKDYAVKINAADFTRVNELLEAEEANNLEEAGEEHYLYKFTDDELKDLVARRDEWSSFDYLLALKILKERGIELDEKAIAEIQEQRLTELKQTEPPQTGWIIAGYICALMGGLLGLFIGWHLQNHTKTLPNGEKWLVYQQSDRAHGRRIFNLAVISLIITIYLRISRQF